MLVRRVGHPAVQHPGHDRCQEGRRRVTGRPAGRGLGSAVQRQVELHLLDRAAGGLLDLRHEIVDVGAESLGAFTERLMVAGWGSSLLGRFGAQGRPSRFDTYGSAAATPASTITSSNAMPPKIRTRFLRFRGGPGGSSPDGSIRIGGAGAVDAEGTGRGGGG